MDFSKWNIFEGKFNKNKPNGQGIWNFPDGNKVKSIFKQVEGWKSKNHFLIMIEANKDFMGSSANLYNPQAFDELNIWLKI